MKQLLRMDTLKLHPSAIVKTSPGNYQAWLRFSDQPIEAKLATQLGKQIAKSFGADQTTDFRHFGRLAGFKNCKSEHMTENGFPEVELDEYDEEGDVHVEHAAYWLKISQQRVDEIEAEKVQARQIALEIAAHEGTMRCFIHDPVAYYQTVIDYAKEQYKTEFDESAADFKAVKALAMKGVCEADIMKSMHAASPDLEIRKKGHVDDYVQRTVRKALEKPDVQAARLKLMERVKVR